MSKQISIPYGSIKSGERVFFGVAVLQFQFLMVRLKGGRGTSEKRTEYISIPYGSIKRKTTLSSADRTIKFQFLMVRLKVRIAQALDRVLRFQFLMVRLKDDRKPRPALRLCDFNSLWFD